MSTIQFETQGYVFTVGGSLLTKTCPMCGVPYALPKELDDWNRKAPHRNFYCPNGHCLHYPGKSDEQKLREATDALARERARHDQTQASLVAQRGAATRARNERDRIKKRVTAGVCPCCNRTFQQLARHMKSKHPGHVAPSGDDLPESVA